MAPSDPMITGIVSVLMPHIRIVSISKSLYLDSFSMTFTDVFLSDGAVMSINLQVFVLWSLITISGLLAVIFLSVCIGISHNIVTSSFSVTVSGTIYIRGCFIGSVGVICFRKFRTPRHDMVHCFVVFVTHPA